MRTLIVVLALLILPAAHAARQATLDDIELMPDNLDDIRSRMGQIESGQLYRVTVLRAGEVVDLSGIR